MALERRLLGPGKSILYAASPGCVLEEEGNSTYEVPAAGYFCSCCENGCGCTACGFTGLETDRIKRGGRPKKTPVGLAALIPAEFFVAPPVKADPSHGKVSVCQHTAFRGRILVAWGKKCPIFDENLGAARQLKAAGYGSYYPDAGGWCFKPEVVLAVLKLFPTLEIDPAVVAVNKPAIAASVGAELTSQPTKHGKITKQGTQYLVCWGNVPKDAFGRYLQSARSIRADFPNSWGWDKAAVGWRLDCKAAPAILKAFPADLFDHPTELAADAEANKPAPVVQTPDPLAERLLAAADAILGGF